MLVLGKTSIDLVVHRSVVVYLGKDFLGQSLCDLVDIGSDSCFLQTFGLCLCQLGDMAIEGELYLWYQ